MTAALLAANGKTAHTPSRITTSPEVRSGQPTIAGTGIPTAIIFERFQAGDSVAELAADYDLPVADIEAAIRFESAVNVRPE